MINDDTRRCTLSLILLDFMMQLFDWRQPSRPDWTVAVLSRIQMFIEMKIAVAHSRDVSFVILFF